MNEPTYTASTVCEVARVSAPTLRAWRNRVGPRGRPLLDLEKGDRQRARVATFRARLESSGQDAGWIDETWDKIEAKEGSWTRYTFADLLAACALAEVTRHGLQPGETTALRAVAVQDMLEQERNPAKGPRYVLEDESGAEGKLTPKLLAYRIGVTAERPDSVVLKVLDTAKLLRRILAKLRELGQPIPGEEPKP